MLLRCNRVGGKRRRPNSLRKSYAIILEGEIPVSFPEVFLLLLVSFEVNFSTVLFVALAAAGVHEQTANCLYQKFNQKLCEGATFASMNCA